MCCKVDISDPLPPLRTYDILNTKLYLSNIYSPERLWCARCNYLYFNITSVKHLKNPSQNQWRQNHPSPKNQQAHQHTE